MFILTFKKFHLFIFPACIFLFTSCENKPYKKVTSTDPFIDSLFDNHSYSNISRIRTHHLDLEIDINFENRTVYGVARHLMKNSGTDTAIFDLKLLDIQKVTTGPKGNEKEADFVIGPWDKDSIMGQPLMVKIDTKTTRINIYYKTTERSEALDWLDPEFTTGKKQPFMYSQGEAILTRSWIPLQDSPANRLTYNASVHVPEGTMPVMSALNPKKSESDNTYEFKMDQAIPSYLIAIAVGNLTYHKLGENCGVYAEPELINACAHEFVDLPKMISAAESLYGEYPWGQYDLIVLPYSFPFGGMENPKLTFVNPTILTGDHSLVSLVAHELAHSWSGNLVTNRSWDDFWLNEGFTVYFENRIMESLYGKEISDILAKIEFQELQDAIAHISKGKHPEDTKLKLNLKGRNPYDGMTDIAYVKGAFLLKTLERDLGRERFDKFLRNYFKTFSFKTVNSEIFLDYLKKNLLEPNDFDFNAEEWIYQEGIPKNCYAVSSSRMERMQWLAKRFSKGEDIFNEIKWVKVKGKKKLKKQINKLERSKYITQEWQAFIRELPEDINPKLMKKLDYELNFRDWGNSEIMCEWYVLGIKSGYKELRPSIARFLKKVGRRKYLIPIYSALSEHPDDSKWAKKVFDEAQNTYHYVSKSKVEQLLNVRK
jgi:leukotriene-A4 hydrolase